MQTLPFLERLKTDPAWAREILMASYDDARRRWQRRWRDGRHPTWLHPRESLPLAFDYALKTIPSDTEFDAVDATIQTLIDDFIFHHLQDAKPHAPLPRHIPRGQKRRRRSNVQAVSNQGHESGPIHSVWISCPHGLALRDHAQSHPVEFDAVLAGCADGKVRQALSMLRDQATLGDIRRATGFTGPRLKREYEQWHSRIFGSAA